MTSFKDVRSASLNETKDKLKEIPEDFLIIKVLKALEAISKSEKSLFMQFREWALCYNQDNLTPAPVIIPSPEKNLTLLAKQIKSLEKTKKIIESYLAQLIRKRCPKLLSISGHVLSAKLIESAGSLEKLANMPSSKIQVLGAERALFTHLKTGAKPPKHGIIISHESVANSENKGKAARKLASKIALAARQDFYSKTKR